MSSQETKVLLPTKERDSQMLEYHSEAGNIYGSISYRENTAPHLGKWWRKTAFFSSLLQRSKATAGDDLLLAEYHVARALTQKGRGHTCFLVSAPSYETAEFSGEGLTLLADCFCPLTLHNGDLIPTGVGRWENLY